MPGFGTARRGLEFQTKVALALEYDELVIKRAYEADLIVEGLVVGELKAIAFIGPRERRQLQTYLELGGYPLGLLLNFGATTMVDGTKRVVNNFPYGGRRSSRTETLEKKK